MEERALGKCHSSIGGWQQAFAVDVFGFGDLPDRDASVSQLQYPLAQACAFDALNLKPGRP